MSQKKARKSKRAFDFARNTMWTIDPDDLCIVGGKKLPAAERGSLDTDDGEEHELYDPRILVPLAEEFILNIDAHGIDTPILIAKIDDVAVVVAGKTRVRAARVVNRRRKAKGEPPLKIDCKIKRTDKTSLLGAMIVENEVRRDDGVPAKIDKLKKLMGRGVSPEDAAVVFGVSLQTVKGWIAFEDNATTETKKAAEAGRLSHTAAATLARIKDPEEQRKALTDLLSTEGRTSRRTAKLAAKRLDSTKIVGVTDKKTQRKLLAVVQGTSHSANASEKTMAWWEGVEDALKLVIGEEDVNPKLTGKLDETISLMKTEARAKKIRTTSESADNAE